MDSGRGKAPIELPEWNEDGTLATAGDLYNRAIAAAPYKYQEPEQRNGLRDHAEAAARRYRVIAERIQETRRQLGMA